MNKRQVLFQVLKTVDQHLGPASDLVKKSTLMVIK